MARPDSSSSISWNLFLDLTHLYKAGIQQLAHRNLFRRVGINGHHIHALSAYPLALAAWEAFLNETCMSTPAQIDYPNSLLWDLMKQAENWSIEDKTILVPKLLLGNTFNESKQPYQDFKILVSIRNHIIHFRPEDAPVKKLRHLAERKITLIPPDDARYSWSLQLQSTEGVRWAINTIAKMVSGLTVMFPKGNWPGNSLAFNSISETEAEEMFRAENLDPDIEDNPT